LPPQAQKLFSGNHFANIVKICDIAKPFAEVFLKKGAFMGGNVS